MGCELLNNQQKVQECDAQATELFIRAGNDVYSSYIAPSIKNSIKRSRVYFTLLKTNKSLKTHLPSCRFPRAIANWLPERFSYTMRNSSPCF
jgi:hypothetical protein